MSFNLKSLSSICLDSWLLALKNAHALQTYHRGTVPHPSVHRVFHQKEHSRHACLPRTYHTIQHLFQRRRSLPRNPEIGSGKPHRQLPRTAAHVSQQRPTQRYCCEATGRPFRSRYRKNGESHSGTFYHRETPPRPVATQHAGIPRLASPKRI